MGPGGCSDPNDCELNQSSLESDSESEEVLGKSCQFISCTFDIELLKHLENQFPKQEKGTLFQLAAPTPRVQPLPAPHNSGYSS